MAFEKFLCIVACSLAVGCRSLEGTGSGGSDPAPRSASYVACLTHYFVGNFGDGQASWAGRFYTKQQLAIVAHLPTRSEFFVYARLPARPGGGMTNNLEAIAEELRERSGATDLRKKWESIQQKVDAGKEGTAKMRFDYLRAEFTGVRFDSDRYPKTDRVQVIVYGTCLNCGVAGRKEPVYLAAVAMIPVEVSAEERARLLRVLKDFLEAATFFRE